MKALVLLIACFALANADDSVKDNVKAWIKDYKNAVNAIGKGSEAGQDAAKLVKEHLNPVTVAELEIFGELCQPAAEQSSSSSSSSEQQNKRTKRDAKVRDLERACVHLFKEWPIAQAKSDALSVAAKTAWNKYMDEEIGNEYYLTKLEIAVRWEIFMSDAKCGCDKFKVKLPKLKLKLAKRWRKFVKKMKIRFEKIGGAISLKFKELDAKLDANWAKFKINAEIGWIQFKADWADFKVHFHANMHAFRVSAELRWNKIKAGFKKAGKDIKQGLGWLGGKISKGVKEVGKGIAKGASKTADFLVKVGNGAKHIFSGSSSSSSSSSSESCELETFIKNNKESKAKIHAMFNAKTF